MAGRYDVIVVGARCAGAPTALLLARRGHRVLLVDRATFPSDTVSTLVIQPPGVAALARWGVLDDLTATGCPRIDRYSFDFGPVVIAGTPHPVDGVAHAYAPRRTVLDSLLVTAAARAGAEVREGFSIEGIVVESDRVVGIRGRGRGGAAVVERADVVVGADGSNSVVARTVRAEEYHSKPALQHVFYSFWRDLPVESLTTIVRGDRGIAAIPTNDGLTLVLVGCPAAQASAFRRDIEGSVHAALGRAPGFAAEVAAATRVERFVRGAVRNFYRYPFGPGWALVGDAGYSKDPITAQGITDAFLAAERCADALHDILTGARTFDDAMTDYQQDRDARSLPLYEFTTQLATLEPPPPPLQHLLAAMAGNQPAMDAFVSVGAGTLSPVHFFQPANIARITTSAA